MTKQVEHAEAQIPDDLVDTRTAARIVGSHISLIYRAIFDGRLRAWKKAGARYWISKADLAGMMRRVVPRG